MDWYKEFIKDFSFIYLLTTYMFIAGNKVKNKSFIKYGAILLIQLVPIFIINIIGYIYFKVSETVFFNQLLFIILPYLTIMLVYFFHNRTKKDKKNRELYNK